MHDPVPRTPVALPRALRAADDAVALAQRHTTGTPAQTLVDALLADAVASLRGALACVETDNVPADAPIVKGDYDDLPPHVPALTGLLRQRAYHLARTLYTYACEETPGQDNAILQSSLLLFWLCDPDDLRGLVRLRCASVDALTPHADRLLTEPDPNPGRDTYLVWALTAPVETVTDWAQHDRDGAGRP